ncbi:branched-chain amino acid ABC transporter permease [Variovorax sp. WS11]|uniref:branched-chain amino acid ABC transporter permease n=1 Tax=Variovorax sp. WS11 TaxID=1105204 RepID=UPI000D0D3C3C|nr:branched-chain amino acid ABC transporter permease [Variovorax sp. WS11]NDZ17337.1 branched-chain amino acid ABC transporter permease [Variovorax sp. WS11]PSL86123.1 branched-chain amino acid ABC transporter permease [Variovorax sp. WS11]
MKPVKSISPAWVVPVMLLWAGLPLVLSHAFTDLLVFTGLYYIAGLGVGLALGQCGIVNLGQALFFGIGAYASAALSTRGMPIIVGAMVGIAIAAAIAGVLGWTILRLHGYFLGLATLALGIIGYTLFFEWDWLTGGSLGIGGIPKPVLLGLAIDSAPKFYYLVWLVAFAVTWMAHNLIHGQTGLLLRAGRDSGEASVSLGIRLRAMRTAVFALCAMLGSLAGSLFAHYASFVSVDSFGLTKSLIFLLVPVLGGMRSTGGMLVGALFVSFVPYFLSRLGDVHQILFGLTMTAVVVLLPNGLFGLLAAAFRRRLHG